MENIIVGLVIGVILGIVIGYLLQTLRINKSYVSRLEFDRIELERDGIKDTLARRFSQEEIDEKYIIKGIFDVLKEDNNKKIEDIGEQALFIKKKESEISDLQLAKAGLQKDYDNLSERQKKYDEEIKALQEGMKLQFENLANKILDEKSEKFTKQNLENIGSILKPLGENIEGFKKKVEDAYNQESKERFSLGKEVQKLVELNQKVSEEANNLTNALKGNSKVQGDWGQMILENILEKSGLVKDREYFVQEFLKDADGNFLKNEQGNKMQPDIIIAYPDNRKVIVDSKVSLTAYARYFTSDLKEEQNKAIQEHIKSIKKHVDELSGKSYQDFASSLDFVMMFVPNEPALWIAVEYDKELWHYAYSRRVILISPTNLIMALKLVHDLWKREYQNRNAQEIAERGTALYEKFVGFVDNLTDIGEHIGKTQKSYDSAFSQLKDGRGNLIGQAEKLKELGLKPKKNLPSSLLTESFLDHARDVVIDPNLNFNREELYGGEER